MHSITERDCDERGWLAESTARSRFTVVLLCAFAVIALVLSATGLYGVTAGYVAMSRRSIGIRAALGASPRQAVGRVFARAGVMAGTGLVAGLLASLALARVIRGMLFQVQPAAPVTYLGVVVLLCTLSRLAWAAWFSALPLIGLLAVPRRHRWILAVGGIAIIATAFAVAHLQQRLKRFTECDDPEFARRYDMWAMAVDIVETMREMVSSLMDLYLSTVSNRMNEIMKVLTIIATIFIPLSFIAGLYGMNFDPSVSPFNMPELGWYWGYPVALAVMALVAVGLLAFFRRRGWL